MAMNIITTSCPGMLCPFTRPLTNRGHTIKANILMLTDGFSRLTTIKALDLFCILFF